MQWIDVKAVLTEQLHFPVTNDKPDADAGYEADGQNRGLGKVIPN